MMLNTNTELAKLNGTDTLDLLAEIEFLKLEYRDTLGLKENTFGVEVEFQNLPKMFIERNKLLKSIDWKIVRDGSIIIGGEVVSPILKDDIKSWTELQQVCELLKKKGAKTRNNTGGHIHFGSQIIGDNYDGWLKFIKLWVYYEKIIFRFAYGDKHCARTSLKNNCPAISEKILSNNIHNNPKEYIISNLKIYLDKLSALNCGYLSEHKINEFGENNTVEVRCPNGSLNPIVWQNNINFFGKMLMACNTDIDVELLDYKIENMSIHNNNVSIYNHVYLKDTLEFADLIFDNDLDKMYFLKQYLKSFKSVKEGNGIKKRVKL